MFDLPSMTSVVEVVVNKEGVDNNAKPLMIHTERKGDLGSAS